MIENFGIGIDIVHINKFEIMNYSKKSSFYQKTFLPSEIEYCLKFKKPAEHFAGKFAIKESVKKSNIKLITIKTTIHNKTGTCLIDGIAKVIVR